MLWIAIINWNSFAIAYQCVPYFHDEEPFLPHRHFGWFFKVLICNKNLAFDGVFNIFSAVCVVSSEPKWLFFTFSDMMCIRKYVFYFQKMFPLHLYLFWGPLAYLDFLSYQIPRWHSVCNLVRYAWSTCLSTVPLFGLSKWS